MKTAILILMFVAACAVDAPTPTSSTAQAVSGPDAHCVLCGGDDDPGGGGNGGGGWLYSATVNFLDANYPGWSGTIYCNPDSGGYACDVDFTWHSIPGYVTCEQLPNDPDDHCGGTI